MNHKNKETAAQETTSKNPLEAKVKALENVVNEQNAAIAKLQNENTELNKQVAATAKKAAPAPPKKPEIPTEPFKVGNKKYRFLFPKFSNIKTANGTQTLTAEQCYESEELLALIVEKYQSLVVEVK